MTSRQEIIDRIHAHRASREDRRRRKCPAAGQPCGRSCVIRDLCARDPDGVSATLDRMDVQTLEAIAKIARRIGA